MSEVLIKINGNVFKGLENGNELGLKESAIFVTNQAKNLAPVDKGELVNSYMYRLSDNSEGGFNDRSGKNAEFKIISKPKKDEAYVGSGVKHAVYQEFGTRKMKPQPALRPAGELLNIDIVAKASIAEMKKALSGATKIIRFD